VHFPALTHAAYWSTVTSNSSIKNDPTVSVCTGCSSEDPLFEPIWKLPAGMASIPAVDGGVVMHAPAAQPFAHAVSVAA
jgi:hypothetical protein